MIVEEIKDSIRKALYKAQKEIIFHFEETKHTDFPSAILSLKDFKTEPSFAYGKQKCDFLFELSYMKSEDNKITELFGAQKMIASALLPAVDINNKKITLEDVAFGVVEKRLIMNFKLSFYIFEEDDSETMQTIDITIKEDKNAR